MRWAGPNLFLILTEIYQEFRDAFFRRCFRGRAFVGLRPASLWRRSGTIPGLLSEHTGGIWEFLLLLRPKSRHEGSHDKEKN
jgi:hypothetical protein